MESFAKLRRRHLVKGESISAIARDLNLSRNTVKKYLKADVGPAYRRQQQPCPKLYARFRVGEGASGEPGGQCPGMVFHPPSGLC